MTPPALLKRFGSREAMMIAALRTADEPAWVKGFRRGPDDRPFDEQLAGLFSRVLEFFSSEAARMSTLCESRIPIQPHLRRRAATSPGPAHVGAGGLARAGARPRPRSAGGLRDGRDRHARSAARAGLPQALLSPVLLARFAPRLHRGPCQSVCPGPSSRRDRPRGARSNRREDGISSDPLIVAPQEKHEPPRIFGSSCSRPLGLPQVERHDGGSQAAARRRFPPSASRLPTSRCGRCLAF